MKSTWQHSHFPWGTQGGLISPRTPVCAPWDGASGASRHRHRSHQTASTTKLRLKNMLEIYRMLIALPLVSYDKKKLGTDFRVKSGLGIYCCKPLGTHALPRSRREQHLFTQREFHYIRTIYTQIYTGFQYFK
jgi:hypothetical protein